MRRLSVRDEAWPIAGGFMHVPSVGPVYPTHVRPSMHSWSPRQPAPSGTVPTKASLQAVPDGSLNVCVMFPHFPGA